jgi:GntR family transcriptional regulator
MGSAFTISQSDKRAMYLAVDLQVSVITVKRAYLELEREGIIVTQQGKGSHVSSTPGLGARLREQELDQHLEQAARIAAQMGLRARDLEHRLREAGDRLAEKETI